MLTTGGRVDVIIGNSGYYTYYYYTSTPFKFYWTKKSVNIWKYRMLLIPWGNYYYNTYIIAVVVVADLNAGDGLVGALLQRTRDFKK